jgi:DNA-directed RNA polymerase subunit RPC12/RpoP
MNTCEMCGKKILDEELAILTIKSKDGSKERTILCQDCSLNFCMNIANFCREKKDRAKSDNSP